MEVTRIQQPDPYALPKAIIQAALSERVSILASRPGTPAFNAEQQKAQLDALRRIAGDGAVPVGEPWRALESALQLFDEYLVAAIARGDAKIIMEDDVPAFEYNERVSLIELDGVFAVITRTTDCFNSYTELEVRSFKTRDEAEREYRARLKEQAGEGDRTGGDDPVAVVLEELDREMETR